ncbi:AAA family ATPase [Ornithinimicrobium cryptoxanthini]|uniref:AAA family ATPase n=1 Tax=Ornithinimicrobium cryptoxanthini TaxID=2934161 RepID=A0ABY4YJ32_9MICO|nr:AAA family ATPase [Ornithinimicrobium cryptoxanthini]USQ76792.1 AAA family ATPase [Ornithinimicrobium cryptoxanthini]
MRLHELRLRDVKGVADRTVTFPDSGIVVIEGPNEVGKSTLLEAFDVLLDPRAKATSQSKAVKALQPVGRDVGPRVEAEFTLGRYRVRFAKQWLRGATTELQILAPVPEQLSGEAAQHRIDQLLSEALDRPLWDALRFTQAGELGQMALTDSAVLTKALDGASGADLHSADGAPLLERVRAEFLRYYTPTGRVGGELKSAALAASAARDDAALAHGELLETQTLVDEHDRLRSQAAELEAATDGLTTRLERALELDADVTAIAAAHEESTAALARARDDSMRAGADLKRREQQLQDLVEAQEGLSAAEQAAEADREALAAAREELFDLAQSRDSARDGRDRAREVADVATADAAHLESLVGASRLTERLTRLAGLRVDEASAGEDLTAAPEIGTPALRALEEAEHTVVQLRARQEARSARVTLEAVAGARAVIINGEAVELCEGQVREVPLRGGAAIELPGELRLSVLPEDDAAELAADLARAEENLAGLLEKSGVSDLAGARAAASVRAAAEAALRAVGERILDVLAGQTESDLAAELESVERQASEHLAARPADYPLPEDNGAARAVARAALAARRESDQDFEQAERALRERERRVNQLEVRVGQAQGSLETRRQQLDQDGARLLQAQEARSDETLRQAVREAVAAYARVEARAAVTGRELEEADVDGVRDRLAQAQRASVEQAAKLRTVQQAQAQLQGKVELVSGEGRQEMYDVAMAKFLQLRQELDTVHRRARAARQLWETLSRHREAAHSAYVRPYEEEIRRLGQAVYGASFDVEVDQDLTIRKRTLDGTSVAFDQLSGGAKEQLGILSRLAVASLVSAGDGVPVIIDDALGYTDPQRLQRMSSIFDAPGERTQVVLLTCTPQRYQQIEGTTTISLTA